MSNKTTDNEWVETARAAKETRLNAKTFTISEVKQMEGMVIPRMEVMVGMVYERKTGTGQYGEWSLQGAMCSDDTGEMKIVFKQYPDQSKLSGRKMVFKSMEGKHGLKGVEVKKNDYKGKVTMELHVSKAALIVSAAAEDNTTLAEPSNRIPHIEPQGFEAPPIKHEDRKLDIAIARNRMTQLAGLYDLSWDTACALSCTNNSENILKSEQIKDIATTLFIQGVREGLADKMPVRTLEKFYGAEKAKTEELEDQNIPF